MKFTKVLTVLLIVLVSATTLKAQLSILSGVKGGFYEAIANDIKRVSRQDINVVNSRGSIDNYEQLINKDNNIYVSFLQYDVLLLNELQNPNLRKELRVLLPLFLDEEIHIIARKESKINKVKDLKGKKVAVGDKYQGTFVTAQTVKKMTKIDWIDVIMSSENAYAALLRGEIDAYFFVGGAPVALLAGEGESVPIKLVNLKNSALSEVYTKTEIGADVYPWQETSVTTYAVPTLMVVNISGMSDDTQEKLNMLLEDTQNGLKGFQENGHPKWHDVYTENQAVNWPFYYSKPVVK
jgi:TRAP transporter TAXI family solute receptor